MALSVFLRSTLNSCKLRPTLGVATNFSKISTASFHRFDFLQRGNEKCAPLKRFEVVPQLNLIVRQFADKPETKKASAGHHDHSKIWTYEKILSAGLVMIYPLGIMYPNVLFDIIMAVTSVMHIHWGFEAIVVDYVRPVIFGNLIPKIALGALYVLSIFILVGLFNLTFNNSGIGNGIRLLWKI
uniref:Succinate dehydrogenase [ubiquinone] cytochrome b small subunit n=1 Tax=Triatoma infestans TaxID=30076 RepID=A0A170YAQ0_TRIIF